MTPYSSSEVTTSPFRQSEWDCRLDHLLQDLETSVEAQRSQSSERTNNNISKSNQKVQIEVEDLGADPTADTGLRHVVFLLNEFEMSFVNFLVVKCNDCFFLKKNTHVHWFFSCAILLTHCHCITCINSFTLQYVPRLHQQLLSV